jgi:2-oxoglutarate dehydrogenase E2 component (dihydrolipoamide succinyltransferase)
MKQLTASEGDTVTPGTKIAVISKSDAPASDTHVAPSEEKSEKESTPKAPVEEKPVKVEPPKVEKPKSVAAPPPKTSPTEPQLPPKDRERRVRT